jgi:hypothetical protein
MEHLIAPNEQYKGCELVFPDSVFFKDGKLAMVVKMDKDLCVWG